MAADRATEAQTVLLMSREHADELASRAAVVEASRSLRSMLAPQPTCRPAAPTCARRKRSETRAEPPRAVEQPNRLRALPRDGPRAEPLGERQHACTPVSRLDQHARLQPGRTEQPEPTLPKRARQPLSWCQAARPRQLRASGPPPRAATTDQQLMMQPLLPAFSPSLTGCEARGPSLHF